ncbi:hypothetical protein PV10_06872 [Exophiala mesophila]|uniref:Uncharacterized protein n=1 Tax=Exophiala mesophila TaxID=212818 RepID=A0A0D1XMW2_EXOME|nr:uncharacterized protein PV10_06872 [Exophiala mesophila]KIV89476.1 hypothetical protein PV10_06872 [Exophiala mesophila]
MSSKRPAHDFTRFTSSQPHATTRVPSPSSSKASSRFTTSELTKDPRPVPSLSSEGAPTNETPLEKVARLRAASRLAKSQASSSWQDRFLVSGRRWADNMHRFATYGLIAFTGVSTVVAIYGVSSLVAHNRRQKRAWIEREMERLQNAQQAFLRGEATAEQLHLLQQERAGEEMALQHKRERERKSSESYWSKVKALVGSQTSQGEMGSETEEEKTLREKRSVLQAAIDKAGGISGGYVEGEVGVTETVAVTASPSGIKGVGLDSKGRPVPEGRVEYVTRKKEPEQTSSKASVEPVVQLGPLDTWAGNAANAASSGGKSWWGWLTGGKS